MPQTTSELQINTVGMAVAYRLLELCQAQDLSLNELSRRSDVPLTTLKNILNGASSSPGVATITKLCGGLGLSLADFFFAPIFQKLPPQD